MKRANGECSGAMSAAARWTDDPHASGIWSFEDLSAQRPVKAELTGASAKWQRACWRDDQQGNRQGPGHQPPHGKSTAPG
jgi:hypothetical protein